MYIEIQSLRGIFAILIFLSHYGSPGRIIPPLPVFGDGSVAFFIMLSGFVMSAGYSERIMHPSFNYKHFMIKRLARFYPLHLLCILGALILAKFSLDAIGLWPLITNVLLLQSWIPVPTYYFSVNAVSWFLSVLMFCYGCFPFLTRCLAHYRKFTITLILSVALIWAFAVSLIPKERANDIIYVNPLARLIDFALGMVLYNFCESIKSKIKLSIKAINCIEIGATTLLIGSMLLYSYIPLQWQLSSFWWVSCALTIFAFTLSTSETSRHKGIISHLLSNRILVQFGNISFSFFMIHVLFMQGFGYFTTHFGLSFPPIVHLTCVLGGTIITAVIINHFFEMPAQHLLTPHKLPKSNGEPPTCEDSPMRK